GDSVKSFVKRRVGIAPGKPFHVFDQVDYVIGSLVFALIAVALPLDVLLAAMIISPVLPIVANLIAYYLGWKKVWW
ncbi:MAG TPA: CDP-archaeol synthase, partial [Candidatus Gracilibacteria bacterium]|nr:CDP-archaeol synthase [Candidatus Gracilibacteria bacterium]